MPVRLKRPGERQRRERQERSGMEAAAAEGSSPPQRQRRPTVTQMEQLRVEADVAKIYRLLDGVSPRTQSLMLDLWRDKHIEFLMRGLRQLGPSYHVLDANRPWLCYWILHSIALLGELLDAELESNAVDFLSHCADKDGGYGGGPGQMPHLATTYAAVNSLITLGTEKALSSIDRVGVYNFLRRMKDSSGGFRMHAAGEMDVRACYTAISVASILDILDDQLVKDVGNYILSCQTYEGGIAGEPGSEAHGGYTFCGLATMILINEVHRLDLPRMIDWVVFRQGVECGFQGRTNKLVDGCYSFWQGGPPALMQRLLSLVEKQMSPFSVNEGMTFVESCHIANLAEEKSCQGENLYHDTGALNMVTEDSGKLSNIGFDFIKRHTEWGPLFDSIGLQQYILLCSQVLEGGFKDKPGKNRDHYHSCYCLSGLSLCQYSWSKDAGSPPLPNALVGPYTNLLEPIHPLYNVVLDRYYKAYKFFSTS